MARLSLAAAVLALIVPAVSLADGKKPAPSTVIPAAMIGEAKPAASCSSCGNGTGGMVLQPGQTGVYSYPPGTFGARLDRELWWENHECAPDGCPKPIGCGNHWTEFKFIFGSCRQFFGTAGSAIGRGRETVER
ncbi:MAG TPA: hypothetical protein VKD71_03040 [Gemmataceae bacterium]|nr:hypothetical protein [Gemmataceae bacterium]